MYPLLQSPGKNTVYYRACVFVIINTLKPLEYHNLLTVTTAYQNINIT